MTPEPFPWADLLFELIGTAFALALVAMAIVGALVTLGA